MILMQHSPPQAIAQLNDASPKLRSTTRRGQLFSDTDDGINKKLCVVDIIVSFASVHHGKARGQNPKPKLPE